jgi:predicted nucleotidyltransferase
MVPKQRGGFSQMSCITEEQLDQITERIARAVNPERVILFGSQARGTTDERSDIDLLIVGGRPSDSGWSRRREIGRIRRSIPRVGIPVDIVLFTPDEVDRWKDTTNHVVSEAIREGRVIYERP